MSETRNTYLDQVVAQQSQLEQELRSKRASAAPMPAAAAPAGGGPDRQAVRRAETEPVAGNAVDVRVTGFLRW